MNVKLILWLVAGVALVGFGMHYRGLHATISTQEAEIDTLQDTVIDRIADIEQCRSDKALTEEVGNDYQRQIRNLRNQLDGLKWVRDNPNCVPIESPGQAIGGNGSAAGNELPRRDGIQAGYLLDFAGRAEEARLKLLSCQRFINETWERAEK